MGIIIKEYQFDRLDTSNVTKPIIYCSYPQEIENKAISISIMLAKELKKQNSTMMRTMQLENDLLNVIEQMDEDPVIKDIDVMFNPEYQADVLKILVSACKKKPFRLIWPGKYKDGKLYYAEEGYKDYISFDVTNYDVTVII